MKRLGFAVSGGLAPRDIVTSFQRAEDLGYESVWMAEGHGGDHFAVLAAAAMRTERIALGTSVSSVFVRSAPTIAMAAASVDALSGGRFILGLGSSHRVQVEPEHGVRYEKPLTRVRESVEVIRRLLRDGRIEDYRGETIGIETFDLWFEPTRAAVPIYVAALFPKMLSAAGEIADGVIMARTTLARCPESIEHVRGGARAMGRDPDDITISTLLPCSVAGTQQEAFDAMRPGIGFYAGFFPRYNRLLADSGFERDAQAIHDAWQRGDRAAAAHAVSDELIDATSIAGTPEQCRDRLEAYRSAGIELPIVSARTERLEDAFACMDGCAGTAPAV